MTKVGRELSCVSKMTGNGLLHFYFLAFPCSQFPFLPVFMEFSLGFFYFFCHIRVFKQSLRHKQFLIYRRLEPNSSLSLNQKLKAYYVSYYYIMLRFPFSIFFIKTLSHGKLFGMHVLSGHADRSRQFIEQFVAGGTSDCRWLV